LRLDDLLRISVRQVIRHKRRYWGVILAITLGVAGLITIITMGREVKKNFNQDLELIGGATLIRCNFDNHKKSERAQWFRSQTIKALRQTPGVMEVSAIALTGAKANLGKDEYPLQVVAVDEAFWQVRSFWALSGRLFGYADLTERSKDCVLGARLAQQLFGAEKAVGSLLQLNSDLYRVIGVMGGVAEDLSKCVFLPLTTAADRFSGVLPNGIFVRCLTWDDVDRVAGAIPQVIQANQPFEGLRVDISRQALKQVKKIAWWIEFLVYLAISATFILGGVGIWNVMMAAVSSRTREIGLKKAMGAQDRDILAQFLSEALCISASGALLGVGLGRLMMAIMGALIKSSPPENLFLAGMSLGVVFAVVLGVGAGLYPSIRASRMEVVTAIRYE
jgi:putative ABC transport system permease protein